MWSVKWPITWSIPWSVTRLICGRYVIRKVVGMMDQRSVIAAQRAKPGNQQFIVRLQLDNNAMRAWHHHALRHFTSLLRRSAECFRTRKAVSGNDILGKFTKYLRSSWYTSTSYRMPVLTDRRICYQRGLTKPRNLRFLARIALLLFAECREHHHVRDFVGAAQG